MGAKGLPWFRMYTDFLKDSKLRSLKSHADERHFIGVLALKCSGLIDQNCDAAIMDEIVAHELWIDDAHIQALKGRLVAARLIDSNWQPLGWDKRQFRSDQDPTGADRQRRFREKQKRTALRNAPVTGADTDTDTNAEEETENKGRSRNRGLSVKALIAQGVDAQHAEDWMALREAKGHSLTVTAWEGIKSEAEKAGVTPAQAVALAAEYGWLRFNADWVKRDRSTKLTAGGWWHSPQTALAKAIEVGIGPARAGETTATWHTRIQAAIDNGRVPAGPTHQWQAGTAADSGAFTTSKSIISTEHRDALLEAARNLKPPGQPGFVSV